MCVYACCNTRRNSGTGFGRCVFPVDSRSEVYEKNQCNTNKSTRDKTETFERAFGSSKDSITMWLSPFTELQGQTFILIVFDEKYTTEKLFFPRLISPISCDQYPRGVWGCTEARTRDGKPRMLIPSIVVILCMHILSPPTLVSFAWAPRHLGN